MGSDIIFPVRQTFVTNEMEKHLMCTGNIGQIYVHKNTNFRDPHHIKRLLMNSNVVVNLLGGRDRYKQAHEFEEANINIPKKIARAARKSGIKKFIHFSSVGVDPKSPSLDLRTRYRGELAVREEFPDVIIFRISPVIGQEDKITRIFKYFIRNSYNMFPIYNDLTAKRQLLHEHDLAEALLNAIKMPDTDGKIYELGGPNIYTMRQVYEILQNTIKMPMKFIKINRKLALTTTKYIGFDFFSHEDIIKGDIDLIVNKQEGIHTIEDLYIEPGSVIPHIEKILDRFKTPLFKPKDEINI